jgi:hypothetical protein
LYVVPLPDKATPCAHSSPTSTPMLHTASPFPASDEHTNSDMFARSCLAPSTVLGISNVPHDSSIFRERRRPPTCCLYVGGVSRVSHMLFVVDIDPSARSSMTSSLIQLSQSFPDCLPPSVVAYVHTTRPPHISCVTSEHMALLPHLDVFIVPPPSRVFSDPDRHTFDII